MIEACKHAKIKPAISFHVLRHTHGSALAMRGIPMAVIAEQLGHADTRMTEKHYAHPFWRLRCRHDPGTLPDAGNCRTGHSNIDSVREGCEN
jgi:integrase